MRKHLRTTILTGLVAFLPLFAFFVVLYQTLKSIGGVIRPLLERMDLDSTLGEILVIALSFVALLLIVYLLGLLARFGPIAAWLGRLDEKINLLVPGYSIIKGLITGAVDEVETEGEFAPVTVKTAYGMRIGFIVDRLPEDVVTVYLPDAPNPKTGQSVIVNLSECTPIDLPAHKVLESLTTFGRGLGEDPA